VIFTPDHAETITPGRAAELLAHNSVNRVLRDSKVRDYADRMTRGEWRLNGATITLDSDGSLIDGQHRLAAAVLAGVPLRAFMVTGLEPDVRPTVDAGLMRVFADDLAILGVTDTLHKAAILRKAVLWDRTHGLAQLGGESVTRSLLMEQWPKYESAVEEAAPAKRFVTGVPVTSGAASFMWWLSRRYSSSPEVIEQFFEIVRDGSQSPADSVVVRLRKFLDTPIYNPRTGRRKPVTAKHEVYYLLIAWNSWLGGEPAALRLPPGGVEDPYPKPLTGKLR
jgi:hypothetical protein